MRNVVKKYINHSALMKFQKDSTLLRSEEINAKWILSFNQLKAYEACPIPDGILPVIIQLEVTRWQQIIHQFC
jgi:hypothetical protein